ncbi:MAG TPA: tyrosine-type recombinase/integrase [Actinocrinis sp.]|jgi:integrase|uniref:tyrosine-type recombinase/integrase n=1 Tax=Actinocrinis sp. TaxID=1920516 RepID=UPI002DDCA52D|nr:tyrosine-type recombinase/integrase [Actinocrinis sp.]HEV3170829.1 tyrosine-type recombinase/integrase [Actinocrinis sp.]
MTADPTSDSTSLAAGFAAMQSRTRPHAALEPATPDRSVSDRTRARIEAATPDNTRRAYVRQLDRFETWCAETGRTPYPATAETLAEFVNHLCDLDLGSSSIDQAITAIRTQHRLTGFRGQPDTEAARRVLKTHRRDRADRGERTHKAPPVTIERLRAMIDATPHTLIGTRDAALLVLGFTLMGRRSELAALRIEDVSETDDGLMILIRSSKTDQDAIGAEIAIPRGVHSATDPVRVVRRYLDALADHGITSGPLLRSVDRHGNLGASISPDGIGRAVRAAAERACLPGAELYSAHGLRAGGATSAYKAGAPVSAIAAQGRWSERSTAVLGYIRAVDKWTDNPMRGVGL